MADLMLKEGEQRQEPTLVNQFIEPLARLRSEVDRVFEDFPIRWPAFGSLPTRINAFMPSPAVEMTETEEAYNVNVEVPGIPASEIEIEVDQGALVIKGEKKEEKEEKERNFTRSERIYGAFERRIRLPEDANVDKVEANSSNGVLKISIGRNREAAAPRRKIEIKESATS